ncbi:MAG TPA: hypothetical protein VH916_05035, partial [Dehalococcoidia bacterium]
SPDERNSPASSRARDFWFFLALRDGRLFNAAPLGYGLHDERLGDVFIDTAGSRVLLAGDDALYEQLRTLHAQWQRAGAPGLSEYQLEFTPRHAPQRPPRPAAWHVERRRYNQWVTERWALSALRPR